MDVVTAYLNGKLEDDVYMEIPEQLRETLLKIVNGKMVGSRSVLITDKSIIETSQDWLEAMN